MIGLTRNKHSKDKSLAFWNYKGNEIEAGVLEDIHVLIHLAGAGVADKRWTAARKKEIIDSRVESIGFLYREFDKNGHWPKQVISASGINYYGATTMDKLCVEDDTAGDDFLAQVTLSWEKAVFQAEEKTVVATLRTAIVLGQKSATLEKMAQPIRYFVGSPLGSGLQPVPWIHVDDVVQAYVHVLQGQLAGAYNLLAPEMVTNQTITKAIGKVLHRPILPIAVPVFVLKIVLGELAEIVTEGTAATPQKLVDSGFQFQYPELKSALANSFQNE